MVEVSKKSYQSDVITRKQMLVGQMSERQKTIEKKSHTDRNSH